MDYKNILTWQSKTVDFFERKHIYIILYGFFILCFFVWPSVHWHNNYFYVIVIPAYLISLHKSKLQVFFHSKLWLISMVLMCYLALTVLWVKNPEDPRILYYLRRPLYLFVFLSMTMELVLTYPKFIEHLFASLAWVGVVTAIISIFCFYSSAPFPETRLEYFSDQLHGEIEGGIVYGMIVLIIYFNILKREKGPGRWLYRVFMAILVGSVLLSQSRGAIGALLATFFVGGLITRDKKLLLALVCLMVATAVLFFNMEAFQNAVTERGLSYRLELGQKTLARAEGDLFFGKGISTNNDFLMADGTLFPHTHNSYLGMILYGGLTGFFILVGLIAVAFWQALRHYFRSQNITYFLLIFFAAISIITGQDKILTHPNSMWIFFWLPLGLLAGSMQMKANGAPPENLLRHNR
ncbi:MAG: O-antigen ligase family protein [Desulfobacterales bacterium]|nr:O-antigen ligase family protein [Desulfobacterales bacterium]